jgi:hypothetical protein
VDGKGKAREVPEPEKVAKAGSSSGPAPGSDSGVVPASAAESDAPQTAREEGPLSTEPDEGIRFGEAFFERARRLGYRVVAEGESSRVDLPSRGAVWVRGNRLIIGTTPSIADGQDHDVVLDNTVDMREVLLLLRLLASHAALQGLRVHVPPESRPEGLPELLNWLVEQGARIDREATPRSPHAFGAADQIEAEPNQPDSITSPLTQDINEAQASQSAAPLPKDVSGASTQQDQGAETEPDIDRELAGTPRGVQDDSLAPSQSEAEQGSSGHRISEIPGQATPAGWHYPAGGFLREAEDLELSERLRPTPEYFKATAHGLGERVLIEGRYLNASEFADLIRNTPDWRQRPLIFVSRGVGDISTQFAERLSRLLGVPVVFASGSPVTWILIDGDNRRELSADEAAALGL